MKYMRVTLWLLLLNAATPGPALAQKYGISTYAGGGPPPTPVQGVDISIGDPLAIAADAAGNAYFASLNCVFKVDQNGLVTRIAGNSRAGYSGDGGPATSAQLTKGK